MSRPPATMSSHWRGEQVMHCNTDSRSRRYRRAAYDVSVGGDDFARKLTMANAEERHRPASGSQAIDGLASPGPPRRTSNRHEAGRSAAFRRRGAIWMRDVWNLR